MNEAPSKCTSKYQKAAIHALVCAGELEFFSSFCSTDFFVLGHVQHFIVTVSLRLNPTVPPPVRRYMSSFRGWMGT